MRRTYGPHAIIATSHNTLNLQFNEETAADADAAREGTKSIGNAIEWSEYLGNGI